MLEINGWFFPILKFYPEMSQHIRNLLIKQCTLLEIILITWEEFFPEFSLFSAFSGITVEVPKEKNQIRFNNYVHFR